MAKSRAAKNKKPQFKKKVPLPLVIFVLIFAAIGSYVLIRSYAATVNGKFVYDLVGIDGGVYAANSDGSGKVKVSDHISFNLPIKRHPNGQYVAYAVSDNGNLEGRVTTIDGQATTTFANPQRCVNNNIRERLESVSFNPELTSSGKPRVVFSKIKFNSNSSCAGESDVNSSQLIAVNGDGSNRVVLFTSASNGYINNVNWSKDGKIYFKLCSQEFSQCSLQVRKTDGSITKLKSNLYEYLLSGDGKKIIYTTTANTSLISQMNSDGTGNKWLFANTFSSGTYLMCTGSAGHSFLYIGYSNGAWRLYYANDAGTIKNKLVDTGYVRACSFSPRSDRIIYAKDESGGKGSIYRVNAPDLTSKTKLVSSSSPISYLDW